MKLITLSRWLFICCGFVFLMIVVGAVTRLTGSGLSITEWKPLMGAIPPLSEKEWHDLFDLYKESPQFQKENFWMELDDFKKIYFWEWFHRLLGRLIGLVYALPLAWFWLRREIPAGYKLKLLGVLVLGGLQGAMGWYMVKSGLVDNPAVSHYRLAAHLLLALLIYGAMLWLGLTFREKEKPEGNKKLFLHGLAVLVFVLMTIVWGAFTAGLDAGLIYNETFPKMGGNWIPDEISNLPDLWHIPAGVQFAHRWIAITTVLMVLGFWMRARQQGSVFHALAVMALLQAALGIATLFTQVMIPLAVLHQAGAVLLLTLLLICLHRLRTAGFP